MAARTFVHHILPGLSKSTIPLASIVAESNPHEDDKVIVRQKMLAGIFSHLISDQSDASSLDDAEDKVAEMAGLAAFWFVDDTVHRAHSYILATSYLGKRRKLVKALEKVIPTSKMASAAARLNISTDQAYKAAADLVVAIPGALAASIQKMIWYIRRDPCKRLPLWRQSPERFVIEWMKASAGRTGANATLLHISAPPSPLVPPSPVYMPVCHSLQATIPTRIRLQVGP